VAAAQPEAHTTAEPPVNRLVNVAVVANERIMVVFGLR
jgi:hypothetical protein